MRDIKTVVGVWVIVLLGAFVLPAAAGPQRKATALAFDLGTGNAITEVVFPALQQVQGAAVSADGSDVTLIVDTAMLLELPWFDAIAPYHPTAVGIFADLGRRPRGEATTRNRNIAVLYASYSSFNRLIPEFAGNWRAMMASAGLDPDNASQDITTPAGLGNMAARRAFESRTHDGMNRFGEESGRRYNLVKYEDYTGYRPVNSPWELRNPSRWQPQIVTSRTGIASVQQFVTPQMRLARPFTYDDPGRFPLAPPRDSDHRRRDAYRRQADHVLKASAELTDAQKMNAELINDKFMSLGAITGIAAFQQGMDVQRTVQFVATLGVASFDVIIAVWHQKWRYDSVRPVSAVRHLYGDKKIRAWGGPGKGTVDDITGKEWRGYLNAANHPDYPSGSAALCNAFGRAASRFLGGDAIQIAFPYPAGSSRVEPGVTPRQPLTLRWNSWSAFVRDCGQSRVWAGVHFQAAVDSMTAFAPQFGDRAYTFIQRRLSGAS